MPHFADAKRLGVSRLAAARTANRLDVLLKQKSRCIERAEQYAGGRTRTALIYVKMYSERAQQNLALNDRCGSARK